MDSHSFRQLLDRLDETKQRLDEKEVSITTLNRWSQYAKDVADYMSNQVNLTGKIPTNIEKFLAGSGLSDEKKKEITSDPYYVKNLQKVIKAVNNNNIGSLGNTGPQSEAGTSFGGGDNTTVTGRGKQVKLDKSLRDLQNLSKEQANAQRTKEFYYPKPPEDLKYILKDIPADQIELTGAISDRVEPTWNGQTADEIRDELDTAFGSRENWVNLRDEEMKQSYADAFGVELSDTSDDTDYQMKKADDQFNKLDTDYMQKAVDKLKDKTVADKEKAQQDYKDSVSKEAQAEIDLEKQIDSEGSRTDWAEFYNSMSDDEFNKVSKEELPDTALDGYLDSMFDRRDRAELQKSTQAINDLNKVVSPEKVAKAPEIKQPESQPKATQEPNYGAMSDDEYEKAYDAKMSDIISKAYDDGTVDKMSDKDFDKYVFDKLDQMDAQRKTQTKDITDKNRLDWDMRRAERHQDELDKDYAKQQADAELEKQFKSAEKAQSDMEKQYDKSKTWQDVEKQSPSFKDIYQNIKRSVGATTDDAVDFLNKEWDKFNKIRDKNLGRNQ